MARSATTSARRRVLVPLATLLAAGAIAVGSGATFTSTSANTISAVTSGTLTQRNSKAANRAIFTLDGRQARRHPQRLAHAHEHRLPAGHVRLTEVASTNGFDGENLKLDDQEHDEHPHRLHRHLRWPARTGSSRTLGEFAAGEATDLHLHRHPRRRPRPNTYQGKTATATYQWDSVQLDGTTTNQ